MISHGGFRVMSDLFLAMRPPWPTSKKHENPLVFTVRNGCPPFPRRGPPRRRTRGTPTQKRTPEHYKKAAPARHQRSTKKHQKTLPKSSNNGLQTASFSSSLLGRFRERPGDAKKHPRERPKTRQEGPKAAHGTPRGLPDPPPGEGQNGSKCNK